MHSGGKYVVIIVFRTAICQLSPSRYLLDPHSSCWVGGWDTLCVCVDAERMHAYVAHECTPDSMPWAIFHHNTSLSNSSSLPPPSRSLSLSHSLSDFLMVYIPSTDSVCLFELFTFFRDAVIHWIYKYYSVCLCAVCMLDSQHSPCNDVQRLGALVVSVRGCRGMNAYEQENKILFAFLVLYSYPEFCQEKQICLVELILAVCFKCTCHGASLIHIHRYI